MEIIKKMTCRVRMSWALSIYGSTKKMIHGNKILRSLMNLKTGMIAIN